MAHYDKTHAGQQDRQLPPNRSYSNYLERICDTPDGIEFNFIFKETGPTNTVSYRPLTAHTIPPDVKLIRAWCHMSTPRLAGLQIYGFDDSLIYESACKSPYKW